MSVPVFQNFASVFGSPPATTIVCPMCAAGDSVAVGDLLVMAAQFPDSTQVGASSVVDSKGNTWTRARKQSGSGQLVASLDIWYAIAAAAGTSADTVTMTVQSTGSREALVVHFKTTAAAPLDQQAGQFVNNPGSGAMSVPATPATTQNEEAVLGFFATYFPSGGAGGLTAGSGFTYGGLVAVGAVATLQLFFEYMTVTATGAQTAAASVAGTPGQYLAATITFKGQVAPVYNVNPSGGIRLGGAATTVRVRAFTQAGGLQLGGSRAMTRVLTPAPSGGIRLGGSCQTTVSAISYAYQWQRDTNGNGVFANIPGATGNIYTTQLADAGCQIRCVVTATYQGGHTAAPSNVVGPIVPLATICQPTGGLILGGSVVTAKARTYLETGGIRLGGQATAGRLIVLAPSGGLRLGGQVEQGRGIVVGETGGIVLGGSCQVNRQIQVGARTGGIVLGGVAVTSKSGVTTVAPKAGIVLGGSQVNQRTLTKAQTGGVRLGGQAAITKQLAPAPTGGIVLGGTRTTTIVRSAPVTGGVRLGGSAQSIVNTGTSKNPVGGLIMGGKAVFATGRQPTGGIRLGGSCAAARVLAKPTQGGIRLGGSCLATRSINLTVQAGLRLGGLTAAQRVITRPASGGIRLGGGTACSRLLTKAPTGGITLGGTRAVTRQLAASPVGGIRLGGMAGVTRAITGHPSGGIALAGKVTLAQTRRTSGGIRLGGFTTLLRALPRIVTGGIRLAGHVHAGLEVEPVGGIRLGGRAATTRATAPRPVGGLRLGGQVVTAVHVATRAGDCLITVQGAGDATVTVTATADADLEVVAVDDAVMLSVL